MTDGPNSIFPSATPTIKTCWVVELGRMEYGAASELQKRVVAARKANRVPDVLLLCEHPHVITLGRSGNTQNLRASAEVLDQKGVTFFESDRGGDITYHGPGQLVGYPILNLAEIRRDVAWYVRSLEEAMMRATSDFGINARRVPGCTGVWVDAPRDTSGVQTAARVEEKLAAIGVHLSRWVTSHGFAYNVSTDLNYFDLIVPCGIAGKRATSLARLLGNEPAPGNKVDSSLVAARIVAHLGEVFWLAMQSQSYDLLLSALLTHEEQPILEAV